MLLCMVVGYHTAKYTTDAELRLYGGFDINRLFKHKSTSHHFETFISIHA